MADTNHLAMSDEEFLKQPLPETGEVSSVEAPQSEEISNTEGQDPNAAAAPETGAEVETPAADPDPKPDAGGAAPEGEADPSKDGSDPAKPEGSEPAKSEGEKAPDPAAAPAPGSEAKPEGKPEAKSAPEGEQAPVDHAKLYGELMAPIRANGKELTIKNAEEARTLMQMGANYTQKMQQMAPHRKAITMLTNNGIDEDKLSFLIDLDKKDPEAIKRLIKDSGIDPLDIDTNTEPAYREGSHKVSDAEQAFRSQLEELGSTPEGTETLAVINAWDQASKDELWEHPSIMPVIQLHRASGVYDQIVTEMDRRKALGQMPADTSFLQGYQTVGDDLDKQGAFAGKAVGKPEATPEVQPKPDPTPVATRTQTPKSDAAAAAAAAAAPSRTAPGKAAEVTNYLSMSDEEFAKVANIRV